VKDKPILPIPVQDQVLLSKTCFTAIGTLIGWPTLLFDGGVHQSLLGGICPFSLFDSMGKMDRYRQLTVGANRPKHHLIDNTDPNTSHVR
jgi:hypothetical protein